MKKIYLMTVTCMLVTTIFAQDDKRSGIAVSLGASANYYYGQSDRNFDKYESDRLNGQLNGMLGLTIARDKNDRRTMLVGFGSFGLNNASTMRKIFKDQNYVTTSIDQSSSNNFYLLEGGVIIAEVLRLSTGVGQQMFDQQTVGSATGIDFQATSLKYSSSTVGFNFNLSSVALNINVNFNYGRDFTRTVIIPSAGLMLRL